MMATIQLTDNKIKLQNFDFKDYFYLKISPTDFLCLMQEEKSTECIMLKYEIKESIVFNQALYDFLHTIANGNDLNFVKLSDSYYLMEYRPTTISVQKFLLATSLI